MSQVQSMVPAYHLLVNQEVEKKMSGVQVLVKQHHLPMLFPLAVYYREKIQRDRKSVFHLVLLIPDTVH